MNNIVKYGNLTIVFVWSLWIMLSYFFTDSNAASLGDASAVTTKYVTAFLLNILVLVYFFNKSSVHFVYLVIYTMLGVVAAFILYNESLNTFPRFENENIVVKSVAGDVPSWVTLILITLFIIENRIKNTRLLGFILLCIIVIGIGHLTKQPKLYGYFAGVMTGVAAPTAIMMFHLVVYKIVDNNPNLSRLGNFIYRLKNKAVI